MTIFDDGAEIIFENWPEVVAATFTPSSGSPVTGFNVTVNKDLKYLPNGFDAQTWGNSAVIEYILAGVGREARTGEKFTVADGTVYTVVDVMENDGRFVKVIAR